MLQLIIGLFLFLAPFVLLAFFNDKKRGFIYVLFFLFVFHTVLGIVTQTFGIFYYPVILACTAVADAVIAGFYFKYRHKYRFNSSQYSFLNPSNVDWVSFAVLLISLITLYQVHYNYTGKINLATDQTVGYHQVKNMVYQYPYFSDEWYSVSLIQGAIENHSLPVKNTLENSFFFNLELFFNSFLAQLVLLLGLNPVFHYSALSLFLNALAILLIYIFLRISNVSRLAAGITSLLGLYITCGANLPGLWHLIPLNVGIIFFLLGICFMGMQNLKAAVGAIILSSIFYPPLVLFFLTVLLVFIFSEVKASKIKLIRVCAYVFLLLLIILPIAFILLMISPMSGMINVPSRIFFISFMAPLMPQINFYDVIPIAAILLAIFGIYYLYKNKKLFLLAGLILGVIFWAIYSVSSYRFFVEYERIAIFTSVLFVIVSGFGLNCVEYFMYNRGEKSKKAVRVAEVFALLVFLIMVPFYTQREGWMKILSVNSANGDISYPKAPANNYLTEYDLEIFSSIKNKKFLSLPWKGTVIGVATQNFPILTKEGTISVGSVKILDKFLSADCAGKTDLVKKYKIDYIYLYEFNCPGFKKIAESQEGLILYSR